MWIRTQRGLFNTEDLDSILQGPEQIILSYKRKDKNSIFITLKSKDAKVLAMDIISSAIREQGDLVDLRPLEAEE
jgi:hypothetical protein